MDIKSEFSVENFISYAKACVGAGIKTAKKYKEGYRTLILPSRGSIPIASGMIQFYEYLDGTYGSNICDGIRISSSLRSSHSFKKLKPITDEDGSTLKIFPYPLTADINTERGGKCFTNNNSLDEIVNGIREYSVRVIRSLYQNPEEREGDKYFKSFISLLKNIEGRKDLADEYKNFPKIEKMIVLDTAISGKASTTITTNFEKLGLLDSLYNILIVDCNGNKLKKEYKSHLYRWIEMDKMKLIPMNRILSEDRGASLLGVVAVTYPDLILHGKRYLNPVGAVTWHPLPPIKEYEDTFKTFEEAIFEAIKIIINKDTNMTDLQEKIDEVTNNLKEFELLNTPDKGFQKNPSKYLSINNQVIRKTKFYESSAHVVHVCLPDGYANKMARLIFSDS